MAIAHPTRSGDARTEKLDSLRKRLDELSQRSRETDERLEKTLRDARDVERRLRNGR